MGTEHTGPHYSDHRINDLSGMKPMLLQVKGPPFLVLFEKPAQLLKVYFMSH